MNNARAFRVSSRLRAGDGRYCAEGGGRVDVGVGIGEVRAVENIDGIAAKFDIDFLAKEEQVLGERQVSVDKGWAAQSVSGKGADRKLTSESGRVDLRGGVE